MKSVSIASRTGPLLVGDSRRVLLRRIYPCSHDVAKRIINSVIKRSDEDVTEELSCLINFYGDRHDTLDDILVNRYREVRNNMGENFQYDEVRKRLIGAYFLHEYSIESAALFNPSVVPHFDQSGLPKGSMRFILSLRATGEGHVSSITLRTGSLSKEGRVCMDRLSSHIREPVPEDHEMTMFNKKKFFDELNNSTGLTRAWTPEVAHATEDVMQKLDDTFTISNLRKSCNNVIEAEPGISTELACKSILLLAEANSTVIFPKKSEMSERVLFPVTPSQRNGIEDARFVLFTEDNGDQMYYATFTAYNGRSTLPQLLITKDFTEIRFVTLFGDISNKGMALFPRRINGKYAMLSRQDDVNVLIMFSESLYKWEDLQVLLEPEQPWEAFKMGNCGSPIETKRGWLVLTHGVGPLRQYCIGAALLDLNDPTKVIARLKGPLLISNEHEREGYVPNVVYSCGALIYGNFLLLPYACSDSFSSFAVCELDRLWNEMGI